MDGRSCVEYFGNNFVYQVVEQVHCPSTPMDDQSSLDASLVGVGWSWLAIHARSHRSDVIRILSATPNRRHLSSHKISHIYFANDCRFGLDLLRR